MSIPRVFTTLEKCNGYLDEFYVTGICILMIDYINIICLYAMINVRILANLCRNLCFGIFANLHYKKIILYINSTIVHICEASIENSSDVKLHDYEVRIVRLRNTK